VLTRPEPDVSSYRVAPISGESTETISAVMWSGGFRPIRYFSPLEVRCRTQPVQDLASPDEDNDSQRNFIFRFDKHPVLAHVQGADFVRF